MITKEVYLGALNSSVWIFLVWFNSIFLLLYIRFLFLFQWEREERGVDLDRWEGGEDLGETQGGETIIRIYYMKKYFQVKKALKVP